jgi:hypothetical protein
MGGRGAGLMAGADGPSYGTAPVGWAAGSRHGRVLTRMVSRSGWRQPGQVAIPDGWHPRVELAGLVEELPGLLVVASGVGGLCTEDQPAGGDLLAMLLPQAGAGRVQGGSLVDQLPGDGQISGSVGLVGPHAGAVGRGSHGSGILMLAL